jgi:hypothetical protein
LGERLPDAPVLGVSLLKPQFDTLYREGETVPRVMAIAVHPFVTGQPHRISALDAAQEPSLSGLPGEPLLLVVIPADHIILFGHLVSDRLQFKHSAFCRSAAGGLAVP